jgi:hypothetical protein
MSKSSLPRIDLLLLPFRGGNNDGTDGKNGDVDDNSQVTKDGNAGQGTQTQGHEDDDDDDDDFSNITDPNVRRIAELSRESGKHRRERNAARKAAEKLQQELEAIKNAGGSEKDVWEAEKAQWENKYNTLQESTSNILLETAIVREQKYQWYDVPVVMGLVDRKIVEIDLEDRVVDGLEAELKRIAKEKPYLLKKGPAGGGTRNENEDGQGRTQTSGSTGSHPNNRASTNDAKAARRAQLEANYPGLNL